MTLARLSLCAAMLSVVACDASRGLEVRVSIDGAGCETGFVDTGVAIFVRIGSTEMNRLDAKIMTIAEMHTWIFDWPASVTARTPGEIGYHASTNLHEALGEATFMADPDDYVVVEMVAVCQPPNLPPPPDAGPM